jgi:hypothetical protein
VTAVPPGDPLVAPPAIEPGTLHRPVRAVVALVELIVAGLAVWGAFWAWPRGFATITTVVSDGTALESERVLGNWLAAAIAFGTVAALLVVDAARQVLLASRVRPRRARTAKVVPSAAAVPEPDVVSEPEPAPEEDSASPEAAGEAAPEARSDARVSGDE